jgi:hypothetical protein
LSAVASGMMALTGIVFSIAFVMVQFNAIVYSPRLVVWFARDRLLFHSMGLFVATSLTVWERLHGSTAGRRRRTVVLLHAGGLHVDCQRSPAFAARAASQQPPDHAGLARHWRQGPRGHTRDLPGCCGHRVAQGL